MEKNIKIKINVSKIYPEMIFYINWAKKSKNKKSKKKIAYKSIKRIQVPFKWGIKRKS